MWSTCSGESDQVPSGDQVGTFSRSMISPSVPSILRALAPKYVTHCRPAPGSKSMSA